MAPHATALMPSTLSTDTLMAALGINRPPSLTTSTVNYTLPAVTEMPWWEAMQSVAELPIRPKPGKPVVKAAGEKKLFAAGPPVMHTDELYCTSGIVFNSVIGCTNLWSCKHLEQDEEGNFWYSPEMGEKINVTDVIIW
ncbi:hypothetical protein DACRYDRAFT_112754 [Dacryopinax primogenitus]|uniref:Uncharacterized protein n=1 Tax=Dacryopinax primogenitus (strain DJM 731) TaxID=1858805 RepID=M5FMX4_DACPD|nr:uncharacterized protein DACRYDRAFT_112754 [Dacryopinax primogenitus]EJT96450.1 hypothetical protein DACRYDRAFT_112754 [Dacryopinax primogenitus]